MSIESLAARALAADGVAPFNEATTLALAEGDELRVRLTREDAGVVTAAALAPGDAPVELVVDPGRRGAGLGRSVVDELLASGEERFWAHGDLPAAQALAAAVGLRPLRTLLVLRAVFDGGPPREAAVPGVEIRSFREEDTGAVIAINGRAFASHPEQGAMDHADFRRRASSAWFDPAGLFVAERDGELLGFHWTKIEDVPGEGRVGEVYVVGVDPAAQGLGLGKALTARGLRHLHDAGADAVDLYVEGDNAPALAVYRGLGFRDRARDTLYGR